MLPSACRVLPPRQCFSDMRHNVEFSRRRILTEIGHSTSCKTCALGKPKAKQQTRQLPHQPLSKESLSMPTPLVA